MNEELTLAIEELRQYGSDREWFIPVLLSECDVPARSIGAGETLLDINWVPLYEAWDAGVQRIISVIKPIPPNIQNLMSALRSESVDVRRYCVEALAEMGPEAAPALIKALRDKEKWIRYQGAIGLGQIGPEAKVAVPALIEALKNKDRELCMVAADSLVEIGPEAREAVPDLIEILEDKEVGILAAMVLTFINTPAAQKALEDFYKKSG